MTFKVPKRFLYFFIVRVRTTRLHNQTDITDTSRYQQIAIGI